jgi:hypothetical protein
MTTSRRLISFRRIASERGATQIGFTDALVAALVFAILLFLAYLQFPAYAPAPRAASSTAASLRR